MAGTAIDQTVGLRRVDRVDELPRLSPGHVLGRVEPDQPDGPVLRKDLADLGQPLVAHVAGEVLLRRVVVPGIARRLGVVPVLFLRVVETQTDASLAAGPGQLRTYVTAEGRGVDDVVGARL